MFVTGDMATSLGLTLTSGGNVPMMLTLAIEVCVDVGMNADVGMHGRRRLYPSHCDVDAGIQFRFTTPHYNSALRPSDPSDGRIRPLKGPLKRPFKGPLFFCLKGW